MRPRFAASLLAALLAVVAIAVAAWPDGDRPETIASPPGDGEASAPTRRPSRRVRPAYLGEDKAAIAGSVTNPSGGVVAGATVCARPEYSQTTRDHWLRPHCVRTDSQGGYRIEGLFPLRHAVDASAPNFLPVRYFPPRLADRVILESGRTTEGIDIVLVPGGARLSGSVQDVSGGPIAAAHVFAKRTAYGVGALATAKTDDAGRYELWVGAGGVSLSVTADGYAPVVANEAAPSATADVYLTPASSVVGEVVTTAGEPVAGIEVSLRTDNALESMPHPSARTDDRGAFRIAGLAPGRYKPRAMSSDLYGEADMLAVGLMEQSQPVSITVYSALSVSGRVTLGRDRQPCLAADAELRDASGALRRARADRTGRIEFRNVVPGQYTISPRCPGTLVAAAYPPIAVEKKSISDLEWPVDDGGSITGVVRTSAGEPVPGVYAMAQAVGSESGPSSLRRVARSAPTAADGTFSITGVAAGKHTLSVVTYSAPRERERRTIEMPERGLVEGVELELLPAGRLEGTVSDRGGIPVVGADVFLNGAGGHTWARTDRAGRFLIDSIAQGPGQLKVTERRYRTDLRRDAVEGEEAVWTRYTIRAGELTRVQIVTEAREGAIEGRVLSQDGAPVEDAFVSVLRRDQGARAGRDEWLLNTLGSQAVLTDLSGRFRFDRLPSGEFAVLARRKGGGAALERGVEAGAELTLRIEAVAAVGGRVRAADGTVPTRFSVRVNESLRGHRHEDSFFRTEGRWGVGGLRAGRYNLVFESPVGSGVLEVEVSPGDDVHDLDVVLEPRTPVIGRIVDLDSGDPIRNRHVQVVGYNDPIRIGVPLSADRGELTGDDGRFTIESAPVGLVRVVVSEGPGNGPEGYKSLFRIPRRLEAGAAQTELGDLQVARRRTEGKKPGRLGFALQRVSPATVPEELKLLVDGVDEGGPAAVAGLSRGDEITSVDGHAVSGPRSYLYHTLSTIPPGRKIELTLVDGRKISITAAER